VELSCRLDTQLLFSQLRLPFLLSTFYYSVATSTDKHNRNVGAKWNTIVLTHVEANIDDATPELLAHAIDLLLQNGAIDAWINPIVMKKGQPVHTLNCLCHSQSCTTSSSSNDESNATTEN
jgi:hypothetical protein